MDARELCRSYSRAHDRMRDIDGLQPQESFDELLKYMFFKEHAEQAGEPIGIEPFLLGDGLFRNGTAQDASKIRSVFAKSLRKHAAWAKELWSTDDFRVTDDALLAVHEELSQFSFLNTQVDVRSAALRTLVTSEIRKGLGVFLTPDDVVRMMVEVADPQPNEVVLDPACGAGTFLTETAHWLIQNSPRRKKFEVFGIDKSPRMLMLAELNLKHSDKVSFGGTLGDSLKPIEEKKDWHLGLGPNSVDLILTNPPFGVSVAQGNGRSGKKTPSEILFIQQCMKLLKPGGRMGIVLPRSVLTNRGLEDDRQRLDRLGVMTSMVTLPAETFAATGTQTTTVVAFLKKHPRTRRQKTTTVLSVGVANVGFDATGRFREGNQLGAVARVLQTKRETDGLVLEEYKNVDAGATLENTPDFLSGRAADGDGDKLESLIEVACTGRTPPRAAYTDKGMFILKVGNLGSQGIDWSARDRNFVSEKEADKRVGAKATLIVREGDILLTSSAHAPKYIAKKVNIVNRIPPGFGDSVTFVGEAMLLRCKDGVDPYALLAFLRQPKIRARIQRLIRGQTAHLDPTDLLSLPIPKSIKRPTKKVRQVTELLREEADLAYRMAEIGIKQESSAGVF